MKQQLFYLFGSAVLIAVASCGNAGGEKTDENGSDSGGQYFTFEVSGPEANIKHTFNVGAAMMNATQYMAPGVANRIIASDDKYSVNINVGGNQPGEFAWQQNVNTVEMNLDILGGDPAMRLMGGTGTFSIKSLDPAGYAEGSYTGQSYLKRQIHDLKCTFRIPYPVVEQPSQEELDAKKRIIEETQNARPREIPVGEESEEDTREERKTTR